LSDFVRLQRMIEQGVLASVTALSMSGQFGRTVQRFTARLFAAGLVHNVASDAHDVERRPPGLAEGFQRLDSELPGLADQAHWFTQDAPEAILAGRPLPAAPARVLPSPTGLRGLLRLARIRA